MYTPGHTAGSVRVHIPELGVLFSGDAIERCGCDVGMPPMYRDANAYRASLERLRNVEPAVVCLSHVYVGSDGSGVPVLSGDAVPRALDESIGALDRFDQSVSAAVTGDRQTLSLRYVTDWVCSDLGLRPANTEQFARIALTVRAHLR